VPYNTSHTTNTHKPQNQTQKKMLASTMQHSTHHHTPKPTTTTTTPTDTEVPHRDALDGHGPEAATRKNNPPTGRCLLRTQQCAELVLRLKRYWTVFHPATPPTNEGVEITRRKPTTRCRGLPPHTGKLLRKEVIQPHLPVRLPCYDFVPIAGPTFDHSPPTRGLGHGLRVLPTFVT
jgi:hypothetical protein